MPRRSESDWVAEEIQLDLLFEDEHIVVLNKPAGLVVHPGAGNADGTLLNALLFHSSELAMLPRAGIVHRLDKDTSGVMVVAKTEITRQRLIDAIGDRRVSRQYQTIVYGRLVSGGSVDAPIGRHRVQRTKMAVTNSGKPAVSHYRVKQVLKGFTHLEVSLESGRTHQIRVHMAHIGHPVLGDPLYGGRKRIPAGLTEEDRQELQGFSRQALHAWKLSFEHPISGEALEFSAAPPADFSAILDRIRAFS